MVASDSSPLVGQGRMVTIATKLQVITIIISIIIITIILIIKTNIITTIAITTNITTTSLPRCPSQPRLWLLAAWSSSSTCYTGSQ